MNKRKIVLLAVALCMVAILGMGGTLAYLTDYETAFNTFTVGNVQINIDEYVYDNGTWAPFVDDTKLNPLENEQGNAIKNKIVYTYNTSSSMNDAYIRTVVLFEKNVDLAADYKNEGECCFPGVHYSYHSVAGASASSDGHNYYGSKILEEGSVTFNGDDYWYVVFVSADESPIPYGAALYSISGVWMDKNITSDTVDGWNDTNPADEKLEVLVCSQAIQAEGLTHEEAMTELGAVTTANLEKWHVSEDANINDLDYKGANKN